MPSKFIQALSKALWDSDLIATRIMLSIAEFSWFIMLAWPGDTFGRPTYTHMALIVNEEVWSIVFLLSAITQFTIVLQEDIHSKFARYFAAWNAAFWGYVVVSMLLSVYPPPAAIGGEIALAFAAGWIWIRPYILSEGHKYASRQITT